ncbi:MAG: RsmE family RNA methyltransferase [Sulfuricaulis sp.]
MSDPWFYFESLANSGAILTLSGAEARHAATSRRLHPGDSLWLFDGHGGIVRAILVRVAGGARELELRVEERRTEPPPKPAIHLACALPKGDRQSVLFDMATQLGMTQFTPLLCERAVVKPGTSAPERWQRLCLEACKQSRRSHMPIIHPPALPQVAVARAASAGSSVWIAHPSAQAASIASAVKHGAAATDVTILVGPEGGFTDTEVAQATGSGAKQLTLGTAILRIETAAVALMAAFALTTRPDAP